MIKARYCTFYIVRHGETESNLKAVVRGQSDSPLTLKGQDQAREISRKLSGVRFDALFASDLGRARQTAEIIALDKQLAVNTTKLLRERNFGSFEGGSHQNLIQQSELLWTKQKIVAERQKRQFKLEPAYESEEQLIGRMLTFLREIAVGFLGKTVLVISHGAIMRALLMHLGFGQFDELPPATIENAGYIVLQSDGADFSIQKTKGITKQILNRQKI